MFKYYIISKTHSMIGMCNIILENSGSISIVIILGRSLSADTGTQRGLTIRVSTV